VRLSLGAVLLTLALGLPLAAAWRFAPLPAKGVLRALVLLPIGAPGFRWGLSLLVLAQATYPPFSRGPVLLLVGQAFPALPCMVRELMTALVTLDSEYLAVAAGLGAGWWERVRRVLLPMLLPSSGVGAALVFVRGFGESNLALMVAPTRSQTGPIWLYAAVGVSGIGQASARNVPGGRAADRAAHLGVVAAAAVAVGARPRGAAGLTMADRTPSMPSSEAGPAIRIEDARVRLGRTLVLDGLSLDVAAGECVALLGSSGKTTILRLQAGLVPAEHGGVYLDDGEIGRLPPERRGLAMIHQRFLLFPHLTVSENVAFGLPYVGCQKASTRHG
jgi:ABC-type molybdate transport system permease subunit